MHINVQKIIVVDQKKISLDDDIHFLLNFSFYSRLVYFCSDIVNCFSGFQVVQEKT